MAANLQEQIERVQSKANVMIEKYHRVNDAFEQARKENSALKAELVARDKEIEQLKMQVEYLSIASTVKMSSADIKSTRAMVADLVREIDRCISDLTE